MRVLLLFVLLIAIPSCGFLKNEKKSATKAKDEPAVEPGPQELPTIELDQVARYCEISHEPLTEQSEARYSQTALLLTHKTTRLDKASGKFEISERSRDFDKLQPATSLKDGHFSEVIRNKEGQTVEVNTWKDPSKSDLIFKCKDEFGQDGILRKIMSEVPTASYKTAYSFDSNGSLISTVSTNYGGEGVDRVNNCADLEFGPRSFLSPLQIPVLLDEACEVKLGDKTQWTQEKVNDSVVIKMLYGKELLPAIVAFPDPELPGYFKKLVIYDRKGETGEEIFQSEETCSFDGSIRKCDETATSPLHGKFYSATASYRLLKKSNLKIGTRAYLQHQFAFDSGTAEWTADQFKYQATATSQGADTGRITVTLNRSVAPSKIDIEVKPSWLSTPFDLSGSDVREIRYVKTRKYDEQGRTTLVEITDLSGVKDEEIAPSEVFKRQFTFGTPSTSPPEHERKNPVISTDSKRVYYLDTAEIAKNLQETTGNDQYQFQARVSNWPAFGKAFANVDRGKRSIYYTDDCLYGLNVEGLPDGSGFIVQISDRPKPPDLKEHHTLAEIRDICLPASSNGLAIELVTIEGK